MRTTCSREIFTKKCRQQQIFDSDLKGAWHYNHVTFTSIAKNFMLYCRLIYTLSNLCLRLMIKVKVGIPESFKVGWYPPKKTGSSHLEIKGQETIRISKDFLNTMDNRLRGGLVAYPSNPERANFSSISLQNFASRSHEKQKILTRLEV